MVSLSDGFQFPDICTPIFELTTKGQAADFVVKRSSLNFKLCVGNGGVVFVCTQGEGFQVVGIEGYIPIFQCPYQGETTQIPFAMPS